MIYLRNVESCWIDVTNQAMPAAKIPSVIITIVLPSVISDAIASAGGSHSSVSRSIYHLCHARVMKMRTVNG